jgi:hypothetical protein
VCNSTSSANQEQRNQSLRLPLPWKRCACGAGPLLVLPAERSKWENRPTYPEFSEWGLPSPPVTAAGGPFPLTRVECTIFIL